MRFKDLPIGAKFEFASIHKFRGMARGPWIKRSARNYRRATDFAGDPEEHEVGSINVEVERRIDR